MKIVVGIDDSPHSRAAIDYVAKASWPKGTRAIVVSSVPPVYAGPGEVATPGVFERLMDEQARMHRDLAAGAVKSLEAAGLAAEARAPMADPRVALMEAARAEHADLVVVGSHGRTGLAKLLIGSVASHVVTHSPCSVLVVKLDGA